MRRETAEGIRSGLVFRPIVEIVRDPMAVVDRALDAIERQELGGAQPTGWMQRLRGRRAVSTTPIGGATLYEGHACCYEHLRRFDGRHDLQLPLETECPGCQRVFRVRLGLTTPTIRR